MGAELVAAALTMEEVVFCPNMMLELGFDESFGSVPLYIDNTSAPDVAGNHIYSLRAKHIFAEVFFRARTGGGRQGQHPLRQERESAGRLGHEVA